MGKLSIDNTDDYTLACMMTYYIFHTDFFRTVSISHEFSSKIQEGIEQSVQRCKSLLSHIDSGNKEKLYIQKLMQYEQFIVE